MAPQTDSHTGGRLEDFAKDGTTIPGDAGVQRIIPSVPRPDQVDADPSFSHSNPAHAADNAFDLPRSNKNRGFTGEVFTATGDQLPSNIEKKRLDDADLDPKAKGHARYYKHAKQGNEFDTSAGEGHDVEGAPGEEEFSQQDLLDRRGAK